jgi:hypothetical protein
MTLVSPQAIAAPTFTNAVIEWSIHTDSALARAGKSTGLASPIKAIVHGAVYDAVNAIDGRYQPYLAAPAAKRWYSQDAASATAAYRTVSGLLPEQEPFLRPLYEASLAKIPDGPAEAGGIRVGNDAAQAMLLARKDDGRDGPSIVNPGTEPGQWRPTPPSFATDPVSWLANVDPFLIPSAEEFRSAGPNPLTSAAYAREIAELKAVGGALSTVRTPDQTDIALFWDESPWVQISRSLSVQKHLNSTDTARLFAMVSLAGTDGAIACHNDKYYWNFWRPITAIQLADTDGNPATDPDTTWLPLLETPPTPDHSSGHTCVSGAVTGALRDFFGTDRIAFSATSNSSGTTRHFTRFSQALNETIDARVFSGIHFRTADTQGADIGRRVARWQQDHYFKPKPH